MVIINNNNFQYNCDYKILCYNCVFVLLFNFILFYDYLLINNIIISHEASTN